MVKFAKLLALMLIIGASAEPIPFAEGTETSLCAGLVRRIADSASSHAESEHRIAQLEKIGAVTRENDSIRPCSAVRSIKIIGAFPLFRSEIEQIMTLRSGDFITPEKRELQRKLITDRFAQAGIIDPKISFRELPVGKTGLSDFEVTISDKSIQMVNRVVYRGEPQFGSMVHGWNFRAWHYKRLFFLPARYQHEDLRDDIRKLREFYRAVGYADCDITVTDSLVSSLENGNQFITLVVTIHPGIEHDVKIGSTGPVRRRTIRDLYDMRRKGNRSAGVLRSASADLKNRLELWGYDSAKVTVSDTVVLKGKRYPRECRVHTVSIDAGGRKNLRKLEITGVQQFKKRDLEKQCTTKRGGMRKRSGKGVFSPKLFAEDCQRIENYIRERGYPRAEAAGSQRFTQWGSYIASVKITENEPCRVDTVLFDSIPESASEAELLSLCRVQKGSLRDLVKLAGDQKRITDYLRSKGMISAESSYEETLASDSLSVSVRWKLKKLNSPAIRSIHWWGNYKTREKLLNRSIDIGKGDPFSPRTLNESVRELRNLGLFASVTPEIITSAESDSLDILIRVEELKRIDLAGSAGFETEKGIYLRGSYIHNNLHGMNRTVRTDADFSETERTVGLSFSEPNFLGTRIKTSVSLVGTLLSEKNVNYRTRTLENSWMLGWHPRTPSVYSLGASYNLKRNEGISGLFFDRNSGSSAVVSADLRQYLLFSPSVQLDWRDSFVKPSRGFYLSSKGSLSHGLDKILDDYWRFQAEIRSYYSPIKTVTGALRLRGGIQRPYGENSYTPAEELFRLGGTASVRGFAENLLFAGTDGKSRAGLAEVDGSAEIRSQVFASLEIPAFIDFGSLSFTKSIADFEPVRISAGTGLRIGTPIGPVGIVYGWKLNRKTGEDPGAFHFSIGYTF